jgi:hypothetical protein
MSILDACQKAGALEIEVGPFHYRLRRVSFADLAEAGFGEIIAMRPPPAKTEDAPPAPVATPDPKQAVKLFRFYDALTAASVEAMSTDGKAWEDVRIVLSRRTSKNRGELALSDLPPGTATAIAPHALQHSANGEAGMDRLRSFLGQ